MIKNIEWGYENDLSEPVLLQELSPGDFFVFVDKSYPSLYQFDEIDSNEYNDVWAVCIEYCPGSVPAISHHKIDQKVKRVKVKSIDIKIILESS